MGKIKNNVTITHIEVETDLVKIKENQENLRMIVVNMLYEHIKSKR